MRPCNLVLIGAGLDWLEGLLPILFVLIWVVSQVMNLFRKGAAGKGGGPANAPRPAVRRPQKPDEGRPIDIDQEIEAFLRRKLQGQQPQPVGPAKREVRKPARPRPPKPAAATSGRPASVPPAAIVPALSGSGRAETRSEAIGGLAGHGGDVARHVASAFAHDLAHEIPLATADSTGPQVSRATDELLAALKSPSGVRQLVLMREVLDRPTHRW
jgi:hypothetical protein